MTVAQRDWNGDGGQRSSARTRSQSDSDKPIPSARRRSPKEEPQDRRSPWRHAARSLSVGRNHLEAGCGVDTDKGVPVVRGLTGQIRDDVTLPCENTAIRHDKLCAATQEARRESGWPHHDDVLLVAGAQKNHLVSLPPDAEVGHKRHWATEATWRPQPGRLGSECEGRRSIGQRRRVRRGQGDAGDTDQPEKHGHCSSYSRCAPHRKLRWGRSAQRTDNKQSRPRQARAEARPDDLRPGSVRQYCLANIPRGNRLILGSIPTPPLEQIPATTAYHPPNTRAQWRRMTEAGTTCGFNRARGRGSRRR